MSDWKFLNANRVGTLARISGDVPSIYHSTPEVGFNGMFRFLLDGKRIRCIASDGGGWKHVSVSIEGDNRPPRWGIMCQIKDLFFEPEDCVVQFHPPQSKYINHHPGCLHIWLCTDGREFPQPPTIMVGPKE